MGLRDPMEYIARIMYRKGKKNRRSGKIIHTKRKTVVFKANFRRWASSGTDFY